MVAEAVCAEHKELTTKHLLPEAWFPKDVTIGNILHA